jgi:hypothetical protein
MPIKTLSRYNLGNLNSFIVGMDNHIHCEDVEIGSDIKIHHHTNTHNEAFGHDQVLITKYITIRFGYWSQVPLDDLAIALGCSANDIEVNIMEDDDRSDRYHYLIPCDAYYHSINI